MTLDKPPRVAPAPFSFSAADDVASMTAIKRLQAAGPATFLVFAVTALLAVVPAWVLYDAVAHAVSSLPGGEAALSDAGGAVRLEAFAQVLGHRNHALLLAAMAATAFLALALSPLLSMTWLRALVAPGRLAGQLRFALSHYLRAVALTLLLALPGVCLLGVAALLPILGHMALASSPDARLHDCVVFALSMPAAFVLLLVSVAHDLGRAVLARGGHGPLRALLEGFGALGPRTLAEYTGWLALTLLVALAGHVAGALTDGPSFLDVALVVALGQLSALGRTLLRGRWLASAVVRTSTPNGFGATPLAP